MNLLENKINSFSYNNSLLAKNNSISLFLHSNKVNTSYVIIIPINSLSIKRISFFTTMSLSKYILFNF